MTEDLGGINPAHWINDLVNAASRAEHAVEDAANKAKSDALSAITDAEQAAVARINQAGKAELAELHSALKELNTLKTKIAEAEEDISHIADNAMQKVLDKLEAAAGRVATDCLQDACDLIDDFEKAGIKGPAFELQLGVVSCSLEDPVARVADLRRAIQEGVHGYDEITAVVNTILPDTVTIEFSAEIEFLVVSSNALEAGVSVTVSRDDLESALTLFLQRLKIL